MALPARGELATVTVDYISKDGHAIIDFSDEADLYEPKYLNLGPLKPETVGKSVEVLRQEASYALCLKGKHWDCSPEEYMDEIDRLRDQIREPPDRAEDIAEADESVDVSSNEPERKLRRAEHRLKQGESSERDDDQEVENPSTTSRVVDVDPVAGELSNKNHLLNGHL